MNIDNRLKKLETEFKSEGENVCQCFDKHNTTLINQSYGDPFIASDILPDGVSQKGKCNRCGQPISPMVAEVYSDINLAYGDL